MSHGVVVRGPRGLPEVGTHKAREPQAWANSEQPGQAWDGQAWDFYTPFSCLAVVCVLINFQANDGDDNKC